MLNKTPGRINAKVSLSRHIIVKQLKDRQGLENIKRKAAHYVQWTLNKING